MKLLNVGGRIVNAYLVRTDRACILVDTGYPGGFPALKRRLSRHGLGPETIDYVFLTHAHDDHAGFLNEILAASDAKVILHEKELERLKIGQNSFDGGCSNRTALWFCRLMELLGRGGHRFPPLEPRWADRCLLVNDVSRQELERRLGGSFIDTPGQTAGSLSLLLEDGTLFCGDAAMNGFPSQNRVTIWIEDLPQFAASWETVLSLSPRLLYPGHGSPFPARDLARNLPKLRARKSCPLAAR